MDKDRYGILIVEDDQHIRNRLKKAIEQNNQLGLLKAVGTLAEAKQALQLRPRVTLVDIGLPDGSGIDLIREHHKPDIDMDFIILSIFDGNRQIFTALEAGATGYLTKDTPLPDIAPAILQVIHGGSPISPTIARKMLARFRPNKECNIHLTGREYQILEILSKGLSHKEAAQSLNVSYHTLISHVKNIYKKLSVNSRAEALFEASRMGIIHHD